MPINYKLYPANWKTEIRPDILARAENKCEQCSVENYSVGYWDKLGRFWSAGECIDLLEESGYDIFEIGNELGHVSINKKPVKVVLTISHTDHNIKNNDYTNLRALCQRCHLHHDKEQHATTKRRKKGIQDLFTQQ